MTAPVDPSAPISRRGTLDILLVEAELQQCRLIAECLDAPGREHIRIEFAHTARDARAAVRRKKYNCVVVCHELPDGHGIDFLEDVGEELLTTPVIGLSSGRDTADPIEYFRAGCIDFFYKHDVLDADKLRRGIAQARSRFHRRAMGTVIARRQLGYAVIKSQEGLIALARTDRLMGICNRGVFDDYFSTHHAEAVGRQGHYALCMIDVDNFKKYNDRYGHAAGDVAVAGLPTRLRPRCGAMTSSRGTAGRRSSCCSTRSTPGTPRPWASDFAGWFGKPTSRTRRTRRMVP